MIHLGFERETGDDVEIPVMHTLTTGITRHGKSETMQAMAERAVSAGYTVLLFDVKTKRDYADVGQEIPIYLEEATDPTTLKGLLETSAEMSLSFQYSELIKVYEPGDDYQAVLDRMETVKNDPDTHPVEEDKLRVLHHLLSDLVRELDGIAISDDLEVEPGINVMNLSDVDGPIQQLAIASTVEAVLEDHEDVILGVDEAHNFIPQKGQPPANQPLVKAIREGAASNVWLYLSDQTITGVDKDPLKQVGVWLLGKQREKNEAQRVLDQIPGRSEFTSEDVMTLSKGNFIVALDDATPLAYVQPVWMAEDEARAIATGEATMDDIQEPDTEDVQEIEEELAEREARVQELQSELDDREDRIRELEEQIDQLNELLEADDSEQTRSPSTLHPPVGVDDDDVREVIEDYIEELEAPESVTVEATRSKLHVKRVVEPIEVTTDDRLGKVAYLYAKEEFPDGEWFTTGDTEEILVSHGWNETVKRTDVLNRMAQMGFLEQRVRADRTREYRVDMPASEAQDEGLLEIETEIA